MRILSLALLALLGATSGAPTPPEVAALGHLRLDEIQVVGTHNSYHRRPDSALLDYLRTSGYRESAFWTGQRLARSIDYDRPPLTTQFDQGIRAIELDVYDDADGSRFIQPPFLAALAQRNAQLDEPWDADGRMQVPGFKTIHKAAYDPRSTCPLFADCLSQIAAWSRAHPDHVPIILMIEIKGAGDRAGMAGCVSLCVDGWGRLKDELLTAFAAEALLKPGDVGQVWPTVDEVRGKVMVMLLDSEAAAASYRAATKRDGIDIMFTPVRPAKKQPLRYSRLDRIAILPNPDDPRIAEARRAGMLVYTRADADTEQARSNDPSRREAAFASGAHFISTDYPEPDARLSGYSVRFPNGGFVRCNPAARCAVKRSD